MLRHKQLFLECSRGILSFLFFILLLLLLLLLLLFVPVDYLHIKSKKPEFVHKFR